MDKRRVVILPYENESGQDLGFWHKLLSGEYVSQISMIQLNPSTFNGWHIHSERTEWHVCIKGNVLIAQMEQGVVPCGEQNPNAVLIPKLVGHGIYNASDDPAWVLVMSDIPHRLGDDEYPFPVRTAELETMATLWEHYYDSH